MMIHQWHVTHILIELRCVPALQLTLQLSQPTHKVTQAFSNFFWLLKNLLKISSDSLPAEIAAQSLRRAFGPPPLKPQ